MGEEVRITDYDVSNDDDDDRVSEWLLGLPTVHDLMPLSQSLVPAELATAFSISQRANEMFIEGEETVDLTGDGSDLRKLRRVNNDNGGGGGGGGGEEADSSARTSKRPRLVWTPQLNKRFVDVVAHLGVKNMVLKTIM
ncbi:putative transcription regulator Homeodomain-LIKE family [Helianthus annuus]|nr:putative transcription regulator Homeodomain-LIKE family [Helianthus annuus]